LSPEDFYGVQHFFVWQRRNTHLERNAGDASKNFVHVKDLFRDRFSIADHQRVGRSARGVFRTSALSCFPGFSEKLEFFRKERIVIFKAQPEEGIRLNE